MTHQICDACECVSLCSKSGCRPLVPMDQAPKFAMPPSNNVDTLQRQLSIAFDMVVRERTVNKELAAVLKDVAWRVDDIRDMLLRRNGRDESIYGCDEWSTPTVNLATAHKVITDALSKVPQ